MNVRGEMNYFNYVNNTDCCVIFRYSFYPISCVFPLPFSALSNELVSLDRITKGYLITGCLHPSFHNSSLPLPLPLPLSVQKFWKHNEQCCDVVVVMSLTMKGAGGLLQELPVYCPLLRPPIPTSANFTKL